MFKCKKCKIEIDNIKIHFEYPVDPKTKSHNYDLSLTCSNCNKIHLIRISLPKDITLNL